MLLRTIAILLTLALSSCADGQVQLDLTAAHAVPTTYDVISIRVNKSGAETWTIDLGSLELTAVNAPLRFVLANAFDVHPDLIQGIPAKLESPRFDIRAKAVLDNQPARETTGGERELMVQKLLKERFSLKWHFANKQMPVFRLAIASGGPHLKVSAKSAGGGNASRGETFMSASHQPVLTLVNMLSDTLQKPVVDKTGLTGEYDYTLRWKPDATTNVLASDDSNLPNLFTATREQLGLTLSSGRESVPVLVIDSIETPASN